MVQRRRQMRGFTIIELMIVVVIIGIMSSIAIPYYLKMSARAYRAEQQVVLQKVRQLLIAQYENNGHYGDGVTYPYPASLEWNPPAAGAPLGQPANWDTTLPSWKDITFSADGAIRMRYAYQFTAPDTLVLYACGNFPGLGNPVACGVSGANYSYTETLKGPNDLDSSQPVEFPNF